VVEVEKMKVAVTSTGESLESQIDMRFGRCAFFVIAEIKDKNIKKIRSIANPNVDVGGGAGISAAEIVANEGVEAIITGNVGPRAFGVFSQFGIKVYRATGAVKDALNKLAAGQLEPLSAATGPMGFENRGFGRRR